MENFFTIRLADCSIGIGALFSATKEFCRDYLIDIDTPPDFSVKISQKDIDFECEKSAHEDELEGIPIRHFSAEYLETLAVYRKIAEKIVDYDTLLFHGSVIAVDGTGYLFTAKSGTGKSTHTRLWREVFGDRAVMVNDDKPLLKVTDDGMIAYGTPWDGKHHLSSNISVPLKAICILERSRENHIESVLKKDVFPMLMQQSYRPADPVAMAKTMSLVDRMSSNVKLYRAGCNMELEAVYVTYNKMK